MYIPIMRQYLINRAETWLVMALALARALALINIEESCGDFILENGDYDYFASIMKAIATCGYYSVLARCCFACVVVLLISFLKLCFD